MTRYFSDQEKGPQPRVQQEILERAWGGIRAAIASRVENASFALSFPIRCDDGAGTCGCDTVNFYAALESRVADEDWTMQPGRVPPTLAILDAVKFCYTVVAEPQERGYHDYFKHYHLTFDAVQGQAAFRSEINEIFARNGLQYELEEDGRVIRLGPEVLRETLPTTRFATGDRRLDALLTSTKAKFLDPRPTVRRESLEQLWDAWERLKTIERAKDKRASIRQLLDRAASGGFRDVLEIDARELTRIGNEFEIRHSETTKAPINTDEQVDYLFHRLFAAIWLILVATGRVGA